MTAPAIAAYLSQLEARAREESIAEEQFRRGIAERLKELERRRAFAYRRLTLVRSVATGLGGAVSEEEAAENGTAAFMREIGWNGATEAQREVAQRFRPVAAAIWRASQPPSDAGEAAGEEDVAVDEALAEFERWFEIARNAPFMSVMDREPLVLPLVEI